MSPARRLAPSRAESARLGASSGKRRVAVITGASRGMGLAIAEALAAAGYDVVLTGRDRAALRSAAKKVTRHQTGVLAQPCDVRDPGSVARLFAAVKKRFGRVDVLVNNAGIAHPLSTIEKLPLKTWREVVDTNLTGLFLSTRTALPLMKAGATIVNNLSVSAREVFPMFSAYTASKFGALGFTNSLREEVRGRGIRVIALLPGATHTDIWKQFWPAAPRRRMLSPASVAASLVHALGLPPSVTVEELMVAPTAGAL